MIKDLITNKDIRLLDKKFNKGERLTNNERALRSESQLKLSESTIQITCNNIIKAKYGHLKDVSVIFQQNDNGVIYSDMKNPYREAAVKKKKAALGTIAGWPDVTIWVKKRRLRSNGSSQVDKKNIFVEFKKIGSPCKVKPSEDQQYWHEYLNLWKESAYFCNNTIYFEQKICAEIDTFLNISP